jgi:hypothetical protein
VKLKLVQHKEKSHLSFGAKGGFTSAKYYVKLLFVFETAKSSATVITFNRSVVAKAERLSANILAKRNFWHGSRVVCSSQSSSLVAKSALGIWHITSSPGARSSCGG